MDGQKETRGRGRNRLFWSRWPAQVSLLQKLARNESLSWKERARQISEVGPQRSPASCRKRWENYGCDGHPGLPNDEVSQNLCDPGAPSHSTVLVLRTDVESVDWRTRLQLAQRNKEVRENDWPFRMFAHVQILSDWPVGLLVTSDWQLGSLGVDYQTWREDLDAFWAIDNLYMVVNGDLIHNVAVHRTLEAVLGQVMTPEEQMLLLNDLLEEMLEKDKLLAVTLSEEHDMRDVRVTGSSSLLQLVRGKRVPLFSNRGVLILQVGKWYYVLYFVHKSRYRSFLNQLHSGQREFQLGVPANVVITSDTHRPAWGKYPWYPTLARLLKAFPFDVPFTLGEEVYLVQTGTYETEARYGLRDYGILPQPKPQILIFEPDRFGIQMCEDFQTAKALIGRGATSKVRKIAQ